jgi:transcriptional regulator with GAF, ATPase, and Fis domain
MNVAAPFRQELRQAERTLVIRYLQIAAGSVTRAAVLSGLHRAQIRRIVVRHGLQSLLRHDHDAAWNVKGNQAWKELG